MRIGYVFTEVPQVAGMFPNAELDQMAARGVEIEIFILRNKAAQTPEAQRIEARFRVHRSPYFISARLIGDVAAEMLAHPVRFLGTIARITRDAAGAPRILVKSLGIVPKSIHLGAVARRRGITLVHAYWASLPALSASIMARRAGVPFTTWAHAGADIYNRNHQTDRALRSRLGEARLVLTCNQANLAHFESLAGRGALERVRLLTHGVDTERFEAAAAAAARARDAAARATASRPIGVLAVGRLSPAKGFDVLIDACAILRDRRLPFACRIVGSGAQADALRARAAAADVADLVAMPGHVEHPELPRLYAEHDVFVMPSVIGPKGSRDGLPNVLLEAMATGLACVGSAAASIPEAIEHERTGLLVPPGDPHALAGAIERLASDPPLRARLGAEARVRVRERYGRGPAMDTLYRLFEELHGTETARGVAAGRG